MSERERPVDDLIGAEPYSEELEEKKAEIRKAVPTPPKRIRGPGIKGP